MVALIQNSEHVSSELFDNEIVVVNFMTGKYFGMSGGAIPIWSALQNPVARDVLLAEISKAASLAPGAIEPGFNAFLAALVAEGLVLELDEAPAGSPAIKAIGKYSEPRLETFEDLQELIALDPIHDTDPDYGWPVQHKTAKPA
jgi:hypothetical protein